MIAVPEVLEGVLFLGGKGDAFCAKISVDDPSKSKRNRIDFFMVSNGVFGTD
jgi:hypothetical protein